MHLIKFTTAAATAIIVSVVMASPLGSNRVSAEPLSRSATESLEARILPRFFCFRNVPNAPASHPQGCWKRVPTEAGSASEIKARLVTCTELNVPGSGDYQGCWKRVDPETFEEIE